MILKVYKEMYDGDAKERIYTLYEGDCIMYELLTSSVRLKIHKKDDMWAEFVVEKPFQIWFMEDGKTIDSISNLNN